MSVLGVMSGTSLDGLDLALCEFGWIKDAYSFRIRHAKTVAYSSDWKNRLSEVKNAGAQDYFSLNAAYGKYIAGEINAFLKAAGSKPDAIASHGHTVFHQPALGFSTQIGCGATIAAQTGVTTVCDFRSLDVAGGGQGAPLVPVGDKLLFGAYEACLNIGGIANISFDGRSGKRIAYDVCVANMVLNYLAERTGVAYDSGGAMARSGKINTALLNELNSLDYYSQKGARSIGREWFEKYMQDLMRAEIVAADLLATCVAHIARIISDELNAHQLKNVLVTGGGAFNTFLIDTIRSKTQCGIILPPEEIINFKEALIFAFLGYLRLNKKTNTLASVTGALQDSIGGAVYLTS